MICYDVDMEQPCCKVVSLPKLKRGEVVQMDVYEVLSLLFLGGTFLVALHAQLVGHAYDR